MSFRHTPDNLIFVNNFGFPLAWFLTQEPGYSLPEGHIGRNYVPHKRHHITKLKGETPCQMDGGYDTEDFLWKEGDRYIAKVQQYIDAYELHVNPPPTAEQIAESEEQQRVWGIKTNLHDIDIKSIRSLREYVAAQPNASKEIKDKEKDAKKERLKL